MTRSDHVDEDRLVAAAVAGDRTAFESILRCYDERLRILAWHMLGDWHVMEDALQDAYTQAFVGLPRFRNEASIGTWLHRIVYNSCLHHMRQTRIESVCIRDPQIESSAERDSLDELVARRCDLSAALRSLPPDLCATLLLAYREGLSYKEIAEVLGIAVGTVGSRLNQARLLLRHALEQSPAQEDQ